MLSILLGIIIITPLIINILRERKRIDPREARWVIEGLKSKSEDGNKLGLQEARAIPNQRLRIVFNLNNAFTSADDGHAKLFTQKATKSINLKGADWAALTVSARETARRTITRAMSSNHERIHLQSLVRVVTLRIMSSVLSRNDEKGTSNLHEVDDDKLNEFTDFINDLWILSKSCENPPRFEDNHRLQDFLSTIFSTNCTDRNENPLNLILPAFETMWRIVLCALIETGYTAARHQHPEWRELMLRFACGQTPLKQLSGHESISAEMLVNEALRLYPPTKRIRRAYKPERSTMTIQEADVEAAQTAAHIWGPTAWTFDPGRWKPKSLTEEQRLAFLPFGSGPSACPAGKNFAPRMIALIVGTLLTELGEGWSLRFDGAENLKGRAIAVKNHRNAYESLYLERLYRGVLLHVWVETMG